MCCISIIPGLGRERLPAYVTDSVYYNAYINNYISVSKNDILHISSANKKLLAFMEAMLQANGLPAQLRNLAIVESGLNNQTISWAGAAGCWQLMPEESRTHGLVLDNLRDERFDIIKSTSVAIRLLKELHAKYDDWLLVIAAYNCGSGRLDKAIKQAGENSFWKIQQLLPLETRNHVRKFVAVCDVLDGNTLFSSKTKTQENFQVSGTDTVLVNAAFRLAKIAQFLKIPESKLNELNSNFECQPNAQAGRFLVLPSDLVVDFMLYKADILRASLEEIDNSGGGANVNQASGILK